MSSDQQDNTQSLDSSEPNPLEFWAAYIPGEGGKKNYLSDGKGHIRLFKSEDALRQWLKPQLSPEVYEMVVVHPVQGKIAIPEDPAPAQKKAGTVSRLDPKLDLSKITPIITLAPPTFPTAIELLDMHKKRRLKRK